jgi:hypothetical protein
MSIYTDQAITALDELIDELVSVQHRLMDGSREEATDELEAQSGTIAALVSKLREEQS